MRTYTLVSPIYIPDGTKLKPLRKYALNMNIYRNTCGIKLNNIKVKYKTLMEEAIGQLPPLGKCRITYTLFIGSRRRTDVSNICCVVDKFFCDALVAYGVLEDDTYEYLPTITYGFGGIDRANPRIEITIEEY